MWASRLLHGLVARDHGAKMAALDRRALRVAHALEAAARVYELAGDAATKQGGGYVLDRRYVFALVERAAAAAEEVVLDLNLLTRGHYLELLRALDTLHQQTRALIAESDAGRAAGFQGARPEVVPGELAAALAAAPVLVAGAGEVVCRGVASGPLRVVSSPADLALVCPGEVVLATRLGPEAVRPELGTAAALLVEGGIDQGVVALAQECRIPALTEVGELARRPPGGTEVTVDADDGTVYSGRVEVLLAYQAAAGRVEEPEYTLLRRVRRALFAGGSSGAGGLENLVEEAAGHIVRGFAEAVLRVQPAAWPPAVLELTPGGTGEGGGAQSVPRPSLEALLASCSLEPAGAPCVALTREERAWLVVPRGGGYDLVVARLGPERYVLELRRLGPLGGPAGAAREGWPGEALCRLGFTVATSGEHLVARVVVGDMEGAAGRLGVLGVLTTATDGGPPPDLLASLVADVLAGEGTAAEGVRR